MQQMLVDRNWRIGMGALGREIFLVSGAGRARPPSGRQRAHCAGVWGLMTGVLELEKSMAGETEHGDLEAALPVLVLELAWPELRGVPSAQL